MVRQNFSLYFITIDHRDKHIEPVETLFKGKSQPLEAVTEKVDNKVKEAEQTLEFYNKWISRINAFITD